MALKIEILIKRNDDLDSDLGNFISRYQYRFEDEKAIRPWLIEFQKQATEWLSKCDKNILEVPGPSEKPQWRVVLEIVEIIEDRKYRGISIHTSSPDADEIFETQEPEGSVKTKWGKSIKGKMEKRQAGESPNKESLRVLVLNFENCHNISKSGSLSLSNESISERIKSTILLISREINGALTYDAVLPACLGINCCFGNVIWLREHIEEKWSNVIEKTGLATLCKSIEKDDPDWDAFFDDK